MRSVTEVRSDMWTAGQVGSLVRPGTKITAPPVVFCHDAGGTGATLVGTGAFPSIKPLLDSLAVVGYPVVGNTCTQLWGNDVHIARTTASRNGVIAVGLAADLPSPVIGISMGCTGAIRWASLNPTKVSCLVLMIPAIDLQYFRDTDIAGARAVIDAALGIVYPTPIPVGYNPATLTINKPILMYPSSTDVTAPPAQAITWGQAQANCTIKNIVGGHSDAAISTIVPAEVRDWVYSKRTA